jgi:hypothetical protein
MPENQSLNLVPENQSLNLAVTFLPMPNSLNNSTEQRKRRAVVT